MENEKPESYKVTLTTGDHAIFTNNNRFDDYPSRLLSGIYGIMSPRNRQNIPMTSESVASIVQVCSHCHADLPVGPGDRVCSSCQGRTWVPAPEYDTY